MVCRYLGYGKMQRRTSSRAPGDAVENRNLVDNSNPKTWQQRFWRYIKDTVIQDYDSVQSILINFGIVAALLLSILMTTMVSVPIEESVRGDILALSLSSAHFRCHFALPNADTIEICNPSFTVALFGTTNAADLCRDGPSMKPISGSPGYWSQFKCAGDIPRSIRGDDLTFWGQKTKAYGPGCSSSSFKEAYRVAENVTENAYLAYLIQELPATDQDGWSSWFGWPGTFNTCRPSGRLATLAFKSLLFLMFALFWDLYLLVSLTFSSASKRPTEMRLWWLSGGAVGALLVMGMLLNGTIHFLWSLEYLVMLRFPSPYDQLIYKIDFMDTFIFYGIWISLLVMGVHFLAVRFDWILVKIWQVGCRSEISDNDAEHEQPSVVEIQQILNRKNRYTICKKSLCCHTHAVKKEDPKFCETSAQRARRTPLRDLIDHARNACTKCVHEWVDGGESDLMNISVLCEQETSPLRKA